MENINRQVSVNVMMYVVGVRVAVRIVIGEYVK